MCVVWTVLMLKLISDKTSRPEDLVAALVLYTSHVVSFAVFYVYGASVLLIVTLYLAVVTCAM